MSTARRSTGATIPPATRANPPVVVDLSATRACVCTTLFPNNAGRSPQQRQPPAPPEIVLNAPPPSVRLHVLASMSQPPHSLSSATVPAPQRSPRTFPAHEPPEMDGSAPGRRRSWPPTSTTPAACAIPTPGATTPDTVRRRSNSSSRPSPPCERSPGPHRGRSPLESSPRSAHPSHTPPSRYWDAKPPTVLPSITQAPHAHPSPPTAHAEHSIKYDPCDRDRHDSYEKLRNRATACAAARYLGLSAFEEPAPVVFRNATPQRPTIESSAGVLTLTHAILLPTTCFLGSAHAPCLATLIPGRGS
ncbi:hypothetical protein B0H13DRAFT_2324112 [Mycena leptocephala]|nr:hypothetical protein B0H13DRAFT_2324112 [Mycena leptocephala]